MATMADTRCCGNFEVNSQQLFESRSSKCVLKNNRFALSLPFINSVIIIINISYSRARYRLMIDVPAGFLAHRPEPEKAT